MSGTYDIDPDSAMQVTGRDGKFTTLIYVEDKGYPTQMIEESLHLEKKEIVQVGSGRQ